MRQHRVRGRLLRFGICMALAGLAGVTFISACNDHGLVPVDTLVKKAVSDSASVQGQTKFDVLWVVDNSNSMCQEQANLTRNFSDFVRKLSGFQANFKMGVITTDVDDADHKGQLQNTPAQNLTDCIRANYHEESNYCTTDDNCGVGGCLCGVPHLQRCETDADCGAEFPACVRSTTGTEYRFCSRTCTGAGDASCLDPASPNGVFFCGEAPEKPGLNHCLLATCNTDADCPADQGRYSYECRPHTGEASVSFCRRAENFNFNCNQGQCPLGAACNPVDNTCPAYTVCPAPTCDCPHDLGRVLEIQDIAGDEAKIDRAVRDFRCMATVGTEGSSTERGLEAIEQFLKRDARAPEAEKFLRKDAHLVVALLSDEDDCSGWETLPQDLGLRACVWYKKDLRPVSEFVSQLKAVKSEPNKVVVATIVGIRPLSCFDGCTPPTGGETCEESTLCADPCPAPTVCGERTYLYDEGTGRGEDPAQSCSSANGLAYAGDRYIDFSQAFQQYGVDMSICQASYATALDRLAEMIGHIGQTWCLSSPLRTCRADADCPRSAEQGNAHCGSYWSPTLGLGRGRCVRGGEVVAAPADCAVDADCGGAGATCDVRNICRWDQAHGGDPADVQVWMQREAQAEGANLAADDWEFLPDVTNGCIGFKLQPGPSDKVDIRYVSQVRF